MNNYAMILHNRVIDVLDDQEVAPKWPPNIDGDTVVAIPCDENVERGMSYDSVTNMFFHDDQPKPLTEEEERQIDILLNTEYIACLLESQLM